MKSIHQTDMMSNSIKRWLFGPSKIDAFFGRKGQWVEWWFQLQFKFGSHIFCTFLLKKNFANLSNDPIIGDMFGKQNDFSWS